MKLTRDTPRYKIPSVKKWTSVASSRTELFTVFPRLEKLALAERLGKTLLPYSPQFRVGNPEPTLLNLLPRARAALVSLRNWDRGSREGFHPKRRQKMRDGLNRTRGTRERARGAKSALDLVLAITPTFLRQRGQSRGN